MASFQFFPSSHFRVLFHLMFLVLRNYFLVLHFIFLFLYAGNLNGGKNHGTLLFICLCLAMSLGLNLSIYNSKLNQYLSDNFPIDY